MFFYHGCVSLTSTSFLVNRVVQMTTMVQERLELEASRAVQLQQPTWSASCPKSHQLVSAPSHRLALSAGSCEPILEYLKRAHLHFLPALPNRYRAAVSASRRMRCDRSSLLLCSSPSDPLQLLTQQRWKMRRMRYPWHSDTRASTCAHSGFGASAAGWGGPASLSKPTRCAV